jgi:hypothetical protein
MKTVKYWEAVKAYQENGTLSRVVGTNHNFTHPFNCDENFATKFDWELQPVKKKIIYRWWVVFYNDGSTFRATSEKAADNEKYFHKFVGFKEYTHEIEVDE